MSSKQIILLAACTVLLVIASVVSASPSDSAPDRAHEVSAKSYFGYQTQPKDSYKKLTEEVTEYCRLISPEITGLRDKIETLQKKLFYRKDKDHGGYNYNDLEQMQRMLAQQKAALDALRNERPSV